MKKIITLALLGIIICGMVLVATAQQTDKEEIRVDFTLIPLGGNEVQIFGVVVDTDTGTVIVGATITLDNGALGVTNTRGYYFIKTNLSSGTHTAECEIVGYEKASKRFTVA